MKEMIIRIDVKVRVSWEKVEEISQIRKIVDKVEEVIESFTYMRIMVLSLWRK